MRLYVLFLRRMQLHQSLKMHPTVQIRSREYYWLSSGTFLICPYQSNGCIRKWKPTGFFYLLSTFFWPSAYGKNFRILSYSRKLYRKSIRLIVLFIRTLFQYLHLMRRLSSLLNDSPSELVARQAYLPATLRVTLCKTKLLSLFIVLADEFKLNVSPWKYIQEYSYNIKL